jgi:hypothetical protein
MVFPTPGVRRECFLMFAETPDDGESTISSDELRAVCIHNK